MHFDALLNLAKRPRHHFFSVGLGRALPYLILLARLRPDDHVIATASDRIARDPSNLLYVLKVIKQRAANLTLLDEPFLDTTSDFADIMAFLLGWAAKWRRRRILEDTATGRARAKASGVKFARRPKLSEAQRREVSARLATGESKRDLAAAFFVSERTISRV